MTAQIICLAAARKARQINRDDAGGPSMTIPTPNVVHMETAARLIREAKEAREKRHSGPHTKRLAEFMENVKAGEVEGFEVIKLPHEDYEAMMSAIATPPQPNEALRRLLHNESVLDRVRGIPAQPATPESEADPRNPIVKHDPSP